MRNLRLLVPLLLSSLLIAVTSCTNETHLYKDNRRSNQASQFQSYAITNVNVIPLTVGQGIIRNATVVIKDKKIFSVNGPIPSGAKLIDGRNKWLIPGLIDMHVHNLANANLSGDSTKGPTLAVNTQDFMLLYIANGVTTVLELTGRAAHFAQRNEILAGQVIGPRMEIALLINGGDGSGIVANTEAEGRQTVRIAKKEGFDFIKVYSLLNIPTYKAIIDEAALQGMKVVGHIPNAFKGKTDEAFVPNFAMVAHAEEFFKQAVDFSDEEARHFAQLAKSNGTWLSPTLITMVRIAEQVRSLDSIRNLESLKYVHPLMQSKWLTANSYHRDSSMGRLNYFKKLIAFHIRLVKAFREAGVPMVAGTDAGTSGVVWGFSLHDELEQLVGAGLTPEEALISATRLPATWLGMNDQIGTIEVGKSADLVLLEANPLENIGNTRTISGVFANGRWVTKKQIDTMLAELAKKNSESKEQFIWKPVP